jgi:hypothetical protein
MDSKIFKSIISDCAKKNGFIHLYGAWFKESDECIIVLCLQKSNLGHFYYLNIKIYVQGFLDRSFIISKDLVKNLGNVFTRQPKRYDKLFNLDGDIDKKQRKNELEHFFHDYIIPFSEKALSRAGIKELAQLGEIGLFPAIQTELGF